MRPAAVVIAYWRELLAIEEDALMLEPIYFTLVGLGGSDDNIA
jgi:hypothetical protein